MKDRLMRWIAFLRRDRAAEVRDRAAHQAALARQSEEMLARLTWLRAQTDLLLRERKPR